MFPLSSCETYHRLASFRDPQLTERAVLLAQIAPAPPASWRVRLAAWILACPCAELSERFGAGAARQSA